MGDRFDAMARDLWFNVSGNEPLVKFANALRSAYEEGTRSGRNKGLEESASFVRYECVHKIGRIYSDNISGCIETMIYKDDHE